MALNQDKAKSNDYLDQLPRRVSKLAEMPDSVLHAAKVRQLQIDPAGLAAFLWKHG